MFAKSFVIVVLSAVAALAQTVSVSAIANGQTVTLTANQLTPQSAPTASGSLAKSEVKEIAKDQARDRAMGAVIPTIAAHSGMLGVGAVMAAEKLSKVNPFGHKKTLAEAGMSLVGEPTSAIVGSDASFILSGFSGSAALARLDASGNGRIIGAEVATKTSKAKNGPTMMTPKSALESGEYALLIGGTAFDFRVQ